MELCNKECNDCPIILHGNSRMVTFILNKLFNRFGGEAYHIIQEECPNLTCCHDCRIDDFCHMERCEILAEVEKKT